MIGTRRSVSASRLALETLSTEFNLKGMAHVLS